MKMYINKCNYYLSTITSKIENTGNTGTFDVSDVTVDWVTLPLEWYYWVDVDFWDVSKREIFRIISRTWYTLTYDKRISPYWMKTHSIWSTVALRDFSELLNSLSKNTDNFWEIEQTDDLKVLVRWWNVYSSWNWYWIINDTELTIDPNSDVYIEYDYFANSFDVTLIPDNSNYLIAHIESNATAITSIEDKRSTMVYWGWEWDMKRTDFYPLYDPDEKKTNVYSMDNMDQWTNQLFISPADKNKYDWYETNKQDTLVSWENIATVNGIELLQPGNIQLDTLLTVWRANFQTEDEAVSYTFEEWYYPLDDWAFIVFSDSGTMMVAGVDYTYDNETYTITFTNPLASSEHAYIWVMYDNSSSAPNIQHTSFITQAQYDVLPDWDKNNLNIFMIYE